MKTLNNIKDLPKNYIRLNAVELSETDNKILFEFEYKLKRNISKKNLIAINQGLFNRIFYINKYKLAKMK